MTKRFIVTCGVLAGATVAFALAGFFGGLALVEWKIGVLGIKQVVMTSPREATGVGIATALMFAWLPISTIVAIAVHRWRRRADPSMRAVLAYFAIPTLLLAGYIVLRTYQIEDLYESLTHAMITLASLGPGADEARLVGFLSVCLWIFIGTRKPAKF